jgi:tetratricopeptide (TPR) repeat protein
MGSGRVEDAQGAFADAFALRDAPDYRGLLALELTELALRDDGEERYYDAARANYTAYIDEVPYLFSIISYGRLLDGWASRSGSGGDPEAVDVFERALSIDPMNPLIRAELAEALNHLALYDEALASLEPQLSIVPESSTFVPYWSSVALAAAHTGDEALARRAIDIALGLAPADETAQEAERVLERR